MGKAAAISAVSSRRKEIKEIDIDQAITDIVNSSQNTLKHDYEKATHSNQAKARYKQILTACALAQSNDVGYFLPKEVQSPLSAILNKGVGIDAFNDNLREFTEDKRGCVLQRDGISRIYRYRFRNPAMQPHVIMRGIIDGLLDEKAKQALSSPEQPSFFPIES